MTLSAQSFLRECQSSRGRASRVNCKELREKPLPGGRNYLAKLYRGRKSIPSSRKSPVWNYDFSQRISSLLGAASAWQVHPAMVWRGSSGVDNVHAIFSSTAGRRLRLRSLAKPIEITRTGVPPLRGCSEFARPFRVSCSHLEFSDHPRFKLETAGCGSSGISDRDTAQRQRGFALFRPLINGAPSPSLVLASVWKRFSLPALFPFEPGFLPFTPGISNPVRTRIDVEIAGLVLVFGVSHVRYQLHVLRLARSKE